MLARYPSPLRYPGGKAKVANFIKVLILRNDLVGIDYVEPYAGGASTALSLLYEDYVDTVHINDLNKGVSSFWRLAVSDPDQLCERIRSVPLTVDEWKRQREVYLDQDSESAAAGFASFYLNRTNRSGIVSGGLIGGLGQHGPWGIDARFDREGLCARVKKIARFRSRINVTSQDACELLSKYRSSRGRRFLYLDPPYYVKGSRLYDNFYTHEDHVAVRDAVAALAGPWVVSYDAAPQIAQLYASCVQQSYQLGYSANMAYAGTEMMFFSGDLKIPDVPSPAGISARYVANVRREATIGLGAHAAEASKNQ